MSGLCSKNGTGESVAGIEVVGDAAGHLAKRAQALLLYDMFLGFLELVQRLFKRIVGVLELAGAFTYQALNLILQSSET